MIYSSNRLSRACALACALTLAVAHAAGSRPEASVATTTPTAQRDGRLALPSDLKCPRDNTTSFMGRVLAYSRGRGRIHIRMRTDEQTTEQFTLRYGKGGFKQLFRLRGEPLGPGDLSKIEARPGKLKPNMRAIIWACYEGDKLSAERIDWRPPEE